MRKEKAFFFEVSLSYIVSFRSEWEVDGKQGCVTSRNRPPSTGSPIWPDTETELSSPKH